MKCFQCGKSLPPYTFFCTECGQDLRGSGESSLIERSALEHLAKKILSERGAIGGERKQVARNTKLILVEGLTGSGKSTTAEFIPSILTETGVAHRCYLENPIEKNPMKFLEASTPTFREDLIGQWLNLVENLKGQEDPVILESVYWQWTTNFMVMHNFPHDDVISINSSLHDLIAPLAPQLVYFSHNDVEDHLRWVFSSRTDTWSNLIINRDMQYPFHQKRGHNDFKGLIKGKIEIQSHTDELFSLTRFQKLKIHDPHNDWDGTYRDISEFILEGL